MKPFRSVDLFIWNSESWSKSEHCRPWRPFSKAFLKSLDVFEHRWRNSWRRVYFCKVASGLDNRLNLSLKALKRVAIYIFFCSSHCCIKERKFQVPKSITFFIKYNKISLQFNLLNVFSQMTWYILGSQKPVWVKVLCSMKSRLSYSPTTHSGVEIKHSLYGVGP